MYWRKTVNPGKNLQNITFALTTNWPVDQIIDLYRAGGWWEMGWNPAGIPPLMKGSFLFLIAIDTTTNSAAGMGRIIADGSSDGYFQDVCVLPDYRARGIGGEIIRILKTLGKSYGLSWMGLIAAPEKENFYQKQGFTSMPNFTPMLLEEERPNRYHDTP